MKKSGKQVNYLFNTGLPIVENFKESEFKFLFNKKNVLYKVSTSQFLNIIIMENNTLFTKWNFIP